jgi:integrase
MSMDVQRHLDEHAGTRPAAANREAKTWGLVFAEARRRWGLTEYNPCAGLAFNPEPPRDVLPGDRDIFRVYRRLDPPARFMVALIRYYGRRRGEILGLTLSSAQADGLHFTRGKRRREIIVGGTGASRAHGIGSWSGGRPRCAAGRCRRPQRW